MCFQVVPYSVEYKRKYEVLKYRLREQGQVIIYNAETLDVCICLQVYFKSKRLNV